MELADAIEELATAVQSIDPTKPEAASLHVELANAYGALFAETGDADTLARSVAAARTAARLVPDDRPDRADLLATVAAIVFEAKDPLDRPEMLDEAVDYCRRAVAGNGSAMAHGNLGMLLRIRYESTGDRSGLDEAEHHVETAVAINEDDETAGDWLDEYGHVLRLRADWTGDVSDARRAVEAIRESLSRTPPGHHALAGRRAQLAGALLDCFQMGDGDALHRAVVAARDALRLHAEDFTVCQIGATVLATWADRHHDIAALSEAETAANGALGAADEGMDRADALDALANVLATKFEMTADATCLDASIEAGERAVAEPAASRVDEAGYRGNLGTALYARYELRGARADLDAAIELDRAAVSLLDEGHPDAARYWTNLGIALRERFAATGADDDLYDAVTAARTAVRLTGPGPDAAFRLANLGTALFVSHDRFGDLGQLDECVDCHRDAVLALPIDHPDLPGQLINLGNCLRVRYERLGADRDLTEALAATRDALAAGPRPRILPDVLSAHGVVLHVSAEHTGDQTQLAQAVEHLRRSVTLSGDHDPELPRRLANLVSVLESATDTPHAAVTEAVDAARRALSALPTAHPDIAGIGSTLALALRARRDDGDADEAIRVAEAAVAACGEDHPDRAQSLMNLAFVSHGRFTETGEPADLDRTVEALHTAEGIETAPPAVRLRAANARGKLAAERGDVVAAAEAFGHAVELLPEVSPQRLERPDAQRWFATYSGLASAAAAMCLACRQPERGVALLELGRGVLLNRSLRLSTDLADLRAKDGGLAARFTSIRDQLDALGLTDSTPPMHAGDTRWKTPDHTRERRRDVVRALTEVVDRIRELPGFRDFLRLPDLNALLSETADGPIVLVNVSEYRCDALMLTTDGVRHVPLPALTANRLDKLAFDFHLAVEQAGDADVNTSAAAEERLTEILDWLWTTVARPVLDAVETLVEPPSTLWWVPTGSLCFLPLHAATSRETGESMVDRIVSSYTPTVAALHHSRQRGATNERHPAVIMASGRDDDPLALPASAAEAKSVADRLGTTAVDAAIEPQEAVLAALTHSTHLHLATHARSDPDDPSASSLLFPGYELSVADMARIRNLSGEFAYLSACETTLTTADLTDEAIHLTSACQLAGFARVVGTQWIVRDAVAARAARAFYDELSTTSGNTALALHQAVSRLRQRYAGHPSAWAAYHHVGG